MYKRGRGGFTAPRRIGEPTASQTGAATAAPATAPAAGQRDDGGSENAPTAGPAQPCAGLKLAAPLGVRAALAPVSANGGTGAYGFEQAAPGIKRPPAFQRPAMVPEKLQRIAPGAGSVPAAGARGVTGIAACGTAAAAGGGSGPVMKEVYGVLFTKTALLAKKKASKQFADGVMVTFEDGTAVLYDQDSKVITKGRYKAFGKASASDLTFELGNWHAEVDKQMSVEDFRSGACFLSTTCSTSAAAAAAPVVRKPTMSAFKPHVPAAGGGGAGGGGSGRPAGAGGPSGSGRAAAAAAGALPTGLHDPHAPGAVVLNTVQWKGGSGKLRDGRPVTPVTVDPYLGRLLRPHQAEGVRFMYEAVMGLRTPDKTGCILADEMGLGKTLQVITLAWTLLRQGPEGRPVAGKVLVVTPATLVDNWGREVKKWLGSERLQALCLQQSPTAKQQILEFRHGVHQKMMITSYETLRKHAKDLAGVFDLLVCDEGHRLKSVGGNKTIDALLSLGCQRRVLLTGTPVQNDLQEFYALLSFVAPDALGSAAVFNRVYGIPITRSQEGTATAEDKELGAARSSELKAKVSAFILRRTQALLAKHLPPLASLTLFCRPTEQQVSLYKAVLRSKAVTSLLGGSGGGGEDNTLAVITALRKVANHPDLLLNPGGGEEGEGGPRASSCLPDFSADFAATGSAESAGKMCVLSELLRGIAAVGERCVVVSTSTAALDLVARLVCKPLGLSTVRIDGATSVDGRQIIVDNFNKLNMGQVFLLSTRAGGAGLNLVGANHLVLYDSDWNPAMDQQAMARIWRDGQTKPCTVYRFLSTGTIEEKVYQRQLMKADLACATMVGGGGGGKSGGGGKFTREELRALFSLNTATASDTRDLLPPGRVAGLRWMEPEEVADPADSPLAVAVATGRVSCINQMAAHSLEPAADAAAVEPGGRDAAAGGPGKGAAQADAGEEDGQVGAGSGGPARARQARVQQQRQQQQQQRQMEEGEESMDDDFEDGQGAQEAGAEEAEQAEQEEEAPAPRPPSQRRRLVQTQQGGVTGEEAQAGAAGGDGASAAAPLPDTHDHPDELALEDW
ncbi:hypothetical protein HYH02_006795 [Chlamydomonas schloesseri]|uniref:Uncharacterized protein n=1 Tax=Chlamydomonas schloesseri TaxID=2026947 RepID=A0A835WIS4_9CHLO|nr:hypothetical protein HYH02_006795 [Chlamydomonas schloesseri]|eukprot:KAG2448210.1 hypothetical protein HYH02_006795 [Chlamydomonas schloesseri]